MKTTIELPDALVKIAKQKAIENGTTLKVLVCSGLQKELSLTAKPDADTIKQLCATGRGIWKGVKAGIYVRALRKGWK